MKFASATCNSEPGITKSYRFTMGTAILPQERVATNTAQPGITNFTWLRTLTESAVPAGVSPAGFKVLHYVALHFGKKHAMGDVARHVGTIQPLPPPSLMAKASPLSPPNVPRSFISLPRFPRNTEVKDSVACQVGPAYHLSAVVHPVNEPEIAAKTSHIDHLPVLPEKRVEGWNPG